MILQKVTDYIIVESNTANALAKLVVDKLDTGYRLLGSPYCDSNDYHYQAMVVMENLPHVALEDLPEFLRSGGAYASMVKNVSTSD